MLFWNNLFRYPRFFISSVLGLFLIIINPLLKKKKNLTLFFLVGSSIFLIWVLKQMVVLE